MGDSGGSAGQARPSSSECTAHASGDQDRALVEATGRTDMKGKERQAMKPGDFRATRTLLRSPPGSKCRNSSLPCMSDFMQTPTRKRGGEEEMEQGHIDRSLTKLKDFVGELENVVGSLYRPSGELVNVTTDIRRHVKLNVGDMKEQSVRGKLASLEQEKEELIDRMKRMKEQQERENREMKKQLLKRMQPHKRWLGMEESEYS